MDDPTLLRALLAGRLPEGVARPQLTPRRSGLRLSEEAARALTERIREGFRERPTVRVGPPPPS